MRPMFFKQGVSIVMHDQIECRHRLIIIVLFIVLVFLSLSFFEVFLRVVIKTTDLLKSLNRRF